eukprot:6214546-Pleurochrysis_carterae.AAC.1
MTNDIEGTCSNLEWIRCSQNGNVHYWKRLEFAEIHNGKYHSYLHRPRASDNTRLPVAAFACLFMHVWMLFMHVWMLFMHAWMLFMHEYAMGMLGSVLSVQGVGASLAGDSVAALRPDGLENGLPLFGACGGLAPEHREGRDARAALVVDVDVLGDHQALDHVHVVELQRRVERRQAAGVGRVDVGARAHQHAHNLQPAQANAEICTRKAGVNIAIAFGRTFANMSVQGMGMFEGLERERKGASRREKSSEDFEQAVRALATICAAYVLKA